MSQQRCWICGKESKTGEHRVKKSDLIHRYGKEPYTGGDELVHVKEDAMRPLQGSNSKLVKYKKNLCVECNNTFTQPFDRAYEELITWAMDHEDDVLRRRVIDFQMVYGGNWESKQRDLFKYFAKCFGCRLDESGRDVPCDVVDLLGEESFQTALYVTYFVNEDQLLLPASAQAIGTAGLYAHQDRQSGEDIGHQCGHHYRWPCFMYWYSHFSLDPVGAKWIADSKHLYLGWCQPLSGEQRADLAAKLAEELWRNK